MTTIKNSYGISVKMMCASCEYKVNDRLMTTRYCKKKQKQVKPRDYCPKWEMSKGLQNAGKQPEVDDDNKNDLDNQDK